jgi:hypothetical protein
MPNAIAESPGNNNPVQKARGKVESLLAKRAPAFAVMEGEYRLQDHGIRNLNQSKVWDLGQGPLGVHYRFMTNMRNSTPENGVYGKYY